MEAPAKGGRICFGVFEADLSTGELTKSGTKLRLQNQPFRVLAVLLERPGELVSREELRQRLWNDGTVVDFDHGLGTAINKIREALSDSAENPRFIETLSRRGYRFIAPVRVMPDGDIPSVPTSPASEPTVAEEAMRPANSRNPIARRALLSAVGLIFLVGLVALGIWAFEPTTQPLHIQQITWSGHVFAGDLNVESFPGLVSDGTRLYFSELRDGRFILTSSLLADGEAHALPTLAEIASPSLADISTDGSKLLIRNHLAPEIEQPLWFVPSAGAAAVRVVNVSAHDATWMPDSQSILFASGHNLYITRNDGREPILFATLPGRAFWLRWSPDGQRLRFTIVDQYKRTTSLWEISRQGNNLRALLPKWKDASSIECCGNWSSDGRSYVFQSAHDGISDIWMLSDSIWAKLFGPRPIRIIDGPLSYGAPVFSRDSKQIYVLGTQVRHQMFCYDRQSHRLERYLPNLTTAVRTASSRDRSKLAWISTNGRTLWVSRIDGSQKLRISPQSMQVYMMDWAPDGDKIAFMGRYVGEPWRIYIISSDGGTAKLLVPEKDTKNQADPSWSPDGKTIAFGRLPAYMAEDPEPKSIYLYDVATGSTSELPNSRGMFSPRWSPDGRHIAAISTDQRTLEVYDTNSRSWSSIPAPSVDNPVWSNDGKFVYFHSFIEEKLPIYRVNIADKKLEQVFKFNELQLADAADYQFQGLAPDESPLLAVYVWTADVYSVSARP